MDNSLEDWWEKHRRRQRPRPCHYRSAARLSFEVENSELLKRVLEPVNGTSKVDAIEVPKEKRTAQETRHTERKGSKREREQAIPSMGSSHRFPRVQDFTLSASSQCNQFLTWPRPPVQHHQTVTFAGQRPFPLSLCNYWHNVILLCL